jgi:LCP family protein required for cell wall assembly
MIDFKQKIIESDPQVRAQEEEKQEEARQERFRRRRPWFYAGGIVAAVIILFSTAVLISGEGTQYWISKIPFFGSIIAPNGGNKLAGETDGRINILLLGMGGGNHDGAYLTDTIMLVSLDPVNKKAALLSIPRDMSVPVNGVWQKINSVNAYAEADKQDGGAALSSVLSDLLGIPIHYYVRVDFEGFVNIVNDLGGIEVNVENTLDDYQYPIMGQEDNPDYYARFEHLHVDKGLQTMDGALALKYVRSRHGIGNEGSDFARSKRQQLVITAVKDKLLNKQNLLKPAMIAKIIGELNQHISTNLKIWEMSRLWDLFKDLSKDDISNRNLDDSPAGYLRAATGDNGAYILLPRDGNFSQIKIVARDLLASIKSTDLSTATIKPLEEPAKVEIENGTKRSGLASQTQALLQKYNFKILSVGNSSQQDIATTTIYDLTYGTKPAALDTLKKAIKPAVTSYELPEWLKTEIKSEAQKTGTALPQPDFILILGADYLP